MNREVVEALAGAKQVRHPGESGRARENIVAKALSRLLPDTYGVSTGFVMDGAGGMSDQQDIVIYRRGYHPVFDVGGINMFTVEGVVAVIQCKATIRSRRTLRDALDNIASVKRLDRSNRGTNYLVEGSRMGERVNRDEFFHQVWAAIVTEASLGPDTLGATVVEYLAIKPPRQWPNMYVDVNGRLGMYLHDDVLTDKPGEGRDWVLTTPEANAGQSVPPLIDLFGTLMNLLRVAPLVDYKPASYLPRYVGEVRRWKLPSSPAPGPTP